MVDQQNTTDNHDWNYPAPGYNADSPTWGEILNTLVEDDLDREVIVKGAYSNRPEPGLTDRWYLATDRRIIFRDTGTSWEPVAGVGTQDNPLPEQYVESLNAANLDNVRYASAFDGGTGGAQIQAAIDDIPSGESGTVIIGPVGPDDVSASSGSVSDSQFAQNAWEIPTHLSIPSNTTLLLRGCYIFLADGADDNLVRNSDFSNGNSHISIIGQGGALVDGNADNQTTFDRSTSDGLKNLGFRFFKVDQIRIEGFDIRNTNAWAIKTEAGDDVMGGHIHFDQNGDHPNQDGWKTLGPATDVDVSHLSGATGDDMVSANPQDPHLLDGTGGDISKVDFSHIKRTGSESSAAGNAVRVWQDGGYSIQGVNISDVTARGGNSVAAVQLGYNGQGTTELMREITVDGVTAKDCDGVRIDGQVGGAEISDVHCTGNAAPLKLFAGDLVESKVSGLNADNCPGAIENEGHALRRCTITDIVVDQTNGTGNCISHRSSNAVTRDCKISDIQFRAESDGTGDGTVFLFDTGTAVDLHITDVNVEKAYYVFWSDGGSNIYANDVKVDSIAEDVYRNTDGMKFGGNVPPVDATSLPTIEGSRVYHNGSGTVGPAHSNGSDWISTVDGSTL